VFLPAFETCKYKLSVKDWYISGYKIRGNHKAYTHITGIGGKSTSFPMQTGGTLLVGKAAGAWSWQHLQLVLLNHQYIHSSIRFHGVVLNYLTIETTLFFICHSEIDVLCAGRYVGPAMQWCNVFHKHVSAVTCTVWCLSNVLWQSDSLNLTPSLNFEIFPSQIVQQRDIQGLLYLFQSFSRIWKKKSLTAAMVIGQDTIPMYRFYLCWGNRHASELVQADASSSRRDVIMTAEWKSLLSSVVFILGVMQAARTWRLCRSSICASELTTRFPTLR
jgi:hypothetical protein